jgi:hypothetical protein
MTLAYRIKPERSCGISPCAKNLLSKGIEKQDLE